MKTPVPFQLHRDYGMGEGTVSKEFAAWCHHCHATDKPWMTNWSRSKNQVLQSIGDHLRAKHVDQLTERERELL